MCHVNRRLIIVMMAGLVLGTACHANSGNVKNKPNAAKPAADLSWLPPGMEVALFAGGCFWCMEPPFDGVKGVLKTTSGYTDGFVENPAYLAVARGLTGHTEAIQVVYDPKLVNYEKLLGVFWRNIDPLSKAGQFCDRGTQYRSGIYTYNAKQNQDAINSFAELERNPRFKGQIATEIKPATRFYPAEEYHQNFYQKKPLHYKRYRKGCGRDQRLKALWAPAKPL